MRVFRNYTQSKGGAPIAAIILLLFLAGALVAAMILSQSTRVFRNQAAAPSARLSVLPSQIKTNQDVSLAVWLNSTVAVGYVQVEVQFDKEKLDFTGDLINRPEMWNIMLSTSSLAEANNAGRFMVALGLKPGVSAPTNVKVVNLRFKRKNGVEGAARVELIKTGSSVVNKPTVRTASPYRLALETSGSTVLLGNSSPGSIPEGCKNIISSSNGSVFAGERVRLEMVHKVPLFPLHLPDFFLWGKREEGRRNLKIMYNWSVNSNGADKGVLMSPDEKVAFWTVPVSAGVNQNWVISASAKLIGASLLPVPCVKNFTLRR